MLVRGSQFKRFPVWLVTFTEKMLNGELHFLRSQIFWQLTFRLIAMVLLNAYWFLLGFCINVLGYQKTLKENIWNSFPLKLKVSTTFNFTEKDSVQLLCELLNPVKRIISSNLFLRFWKYQPFLLLCGRSAKNLF